MRCGVRSRRPASKAGFDLAQDVWAREGRDYFVLAGGGLFSQCVHCYSPMVNSSVYPNRTPLSINLTQRGVNR